MQNSNGFYHGKDLTAENMKMRTCTCDDYDFLEYFASS